jgi:hypothetical protein
MRIDTADRLSNTMHVMRACRLFNHKFVSRVTIEALMVELECLSYLPIRADMPGDVFLGELADYKRLAEEEGGRTAAVGDEGGAAGADEDRGGLAKDPDLFSRFWKRSSLKIPNWYKASREVALIVPSSAAVERVFSLLTQVFDSSQNSALSDYKAAGVMLRYNRDIWGSMK